jgi:hypothetical protein
MDIFFTDKSVPRPSRSPFNEDLEDERELIPRRRWCWEALKCDSIRETSAEARARVRSIGQSPSSRSPPLRGLRVA